MILLTVFVDLIAAVGIGLFVANVMTITRLSELQQSDVEVIDSEHATDESITPYEKDLLESSDGKVMLLQLQGSMIFGVSRAISKTNSVIMGCRSLIVDITRVPHLGVSSALALEESIRTLLQSGKNILIVHADGQPIERLERLGVLALIPPKNIVNDRRKALETAVYG